jgi:uncharacterized protein
MSRRDEYLPGVPCWVETLQLEPRSALGFYGPLLGWTFCEPEVMLGGLRGDYFLARIEDGDVAGIGMLPERGGSPLPVWITSVRVDSADEALGLASAAGGRVLLGPLDRTPGGRWAVITDPAGAAFGVWEAHRHAGARLVNQPGTWAMSSLHTPDPAGATAFYGAVFGWQSEPIAPGAPVTLFRLSGYIGGDPDQGMPRDVVAVMTATETGPDGLVIPPHWNVNLRVSDTDAVVARVAELGGSVLMPPMDTPGFRSAVVLDPRGAAFSVSEVIPDTYQTRAS